MLNIKKIKKTQKVDIVVMVVLRKQGMKVGLLGHLKRSLWGGVDGGTRG